MSDSRARLEWLFSNRFLVVWCVIFLAAGFVTEWNFYSDKPRFLEDFHHYLNAWDGGSRTANPYANRRIGSAFLYPPPSLIAVGAFDLVFQNDDQLLLGYMAINSALLIMLVAGVARRFEVPLSSSWWWYIMAAGFAPTLETFHLGQINVITAFAVFLVFYFQDDRPAVAGLGLAAAIVTKLTPLVLCGYLIATRRYRALGYGLLSLVGLSLIPLLYYGVDIYPEYLDVVGELRIKFFASTNSQSLVAILVNPGFFDTGSSSAIQTLLTGYTVSIFIASACCAWLVGSHRQLLIVVLLLTTVLPNLMWYHHYVFLLIPLLIWLGMEGDRPLVVGWILLGTLIIQADRDHGILSFSHGLLTHLFVHLSALALVIGQINKARRNRSEWIWSLSSRQPAGRAKAGLELVE